jgi:hypothetical protein
MHIKCFCVDFLPNNRPLLLTNKSMLNKDNFQTSFTSVYLRKKVLHGLLIYKKKT